MKKTDVQELKEKLETKGVVVNSEMLKQLNKLDLYTIDKLKRM